MEEIRALPPGLPHDSLVFIVICDVSVGVGLRGRTVGSSCGREGCFRSMSVDSVSRVHLNTVRGWDQHGLLAGKF